MNKKHYYFDQESCSYKQVKTTFLETFLNFGGILVLCLFLGFAFSLAYSAYFPSVKEQKLVKENKNLNESITLLSKDVHQLGEIVEILEDRDNNIYRVIFEAEPIKDNFRNLGIGGGVNPKSYEDLSNSNNIKNMEQSLEKIKYKLYVQSNSYNELLDLAKNKQKIISSIPAIQPIANKDLRRLASGFGVRIHPIYKVRRMHKGCDFSAPSGTPVYATGDGIVITAKLRSGYGNLIEIKHGAGYKTRYAHLSKFSVRRGQKVKRGQMIGKVGSTGVSVAPHLHYEVAYNGVEVNPINFFHNDLTPEQYEQLLQIASVENQSLGF